MRKLVKEKVNASKIKTRVILPREGSVLPLSASIVPGEKRQLFLPQHAGWQGARLAPSGYGNTWRWAGSTAEAPGFTSWHDRYLCNASCLQSHLGNVDLDYFFKGKRYSQLFSSVPCTCSLLLFLILKKK